MCGLAGRLVLERDDVIVTILVVPHLLGQSRSEISRYLPNGQKALQRIRYEPHTNIPA